MLYTFFSFTRGRHNRPTSYYIEVFSQKKVNLYLINNAFIPLAVRYILFTLHIYHVATSIVFIVFKFLKS